ncbi:MAG: JAB domain-containing protein [Flavisolibacter sp.]
MEHSLSLEVINNVSEIEIIYKKKVKCKVSERPQICSSHDAYDVLAHYWDQDKIDLLEEFKVLYLNRSNRVLQIIALSQGGISGTIADPRLILAAALKVAATAIVLAHNHPSTGLKPSRADEELTQKIKHAAAFHDIKVIDHIILTSEGYFSFSDEGLL